MLRLKLRLIGIDQKAQEANRINSANFNAMTLNLAENFDHLFSHIFILGNVFAQGLGVDAVMITSWKYFVSRHKLAMKILKKKNRFIHETLNKL